MLQVFKILKIGNSVYCGVSFSRSRRKKVLRKACKCTSKGLQKFYCSTEKLLNIFETAIFKNNFVAYRDFTEYKNVSEYKKVSKYKNFSEYKKVSEYINFTDFKNFTEYKKVSEYKYFSEFKY